MHQGAQGLWFCHLCLSPFAQVGSDWCSRKGTQVKPAIAFSLWKTKVIFLVLRISCCWTNFLDMHRSPKTFIHRSKEWTTFAAWNWGKPWQNFPNTIAGHDNPGCCIHLSEMLLSIFMHRCTFNEKDKADKIWFFLSKKNIQISSMLEQFLWESVCHGCANSFFASESIERSNKPSIASMTFQILTVENWIWSLTSNKNAQISIAFWEHCWPSQTQHQCCLVLVCFLFLTVSLSP